MTSLLSGFLIEAIPLLLLLIPSPRCPHERVRVAVLAYPGTVR